MHYNSNSRRKSNYEERYRQEPIYYNSRKTKEEQKSKLNIDLSEELAIFDKTSTTKDKEKRVEEKHYTILNRNSLEQFKYLGSISTTYFDDKYELVLKKDTYWKSYPRFTVKYQLPHLKESSDYYHHSLNLDSLPLFTMKEIYYGNNLSTFYDEEVYCSIKEILRNNSIIDNYEEYKYGYLCHDDSIICGTVSKLPSNSFESKCIENYSSYFNSYSKRILLFDDIKENCNSCIKFTYQNKLPVYDDFSQLLEKKMLITKDNYKIHINSILKNEIKESFELPIITKGNITSEEIDSIILKLQDYQNINFDFISKICSSLDDFKERINLKRTIYKKESNILLPSNFMKKPYSDALKQIESNKELYFNYAKNYYESLTNQSIDKVKQIVKKK